MLQCLLVYTGRQTLLRYVFDQNNYTAMRAGVGGVSKIKDLFGTDQNSCDFRARRNSFVFPCLLDNNESDHQ